MRRRVIIEVSGMEGFSLGVLLFVNGWLDIRFELRYVWFPMFNSRAMALFM